MSLHCAGCRAQLPPDARFCGECGTPTRAHVRAVVHRGVVERRHGLRAALAFGTVACGVLLSLLGVPQWFGWDGGHGWAAEVVGWLVIATVGATAAVVGGEWRATQPLFVRWPWLVAAVPAAAVSLAIAFGYSALWPHASAPSEAVTIVMWVGGVVFAPIVEEWLCRGVAWQAAVTMASPRAAWVLTSVLFGFLHGLNGGYLLEVPHRCAVGLVFGWLRWRSGSLLPGMLAHALHNAAALGWAGG